jgi:protein MpaA
MAQAWNWSFDKACHCCFLDALATEDTHRPYPPSIASALGELRHVDSPHLTARQLSLSDGSTLLRLDFVGPKAAHDSIRIGLFTGIHGDEPAGPLAAAKLLSRLAREPRLAAGYHLTVYPTINQAGLVAGTRGDQDGVDLNREFWKGSSRPVVRLLEQELREARFHGIIALHADDTCDGLYGYAHGRLLNEELLRPALRASGQHLPMDERPLIDGFEADDGVIHFCFPGVLSAPPDQHPAPFDIILETPAKADEALQADAMVDGVLAILAEYRRFIAFGADL